MEFTVYAIKPVLTSQTHSIFSKVLFSLRVLLVYTAESGSAFFHWLFYLNGFSNSVFTYIIMQRTRRLDVLMVVTTKIKLSSEMLYHVAFVEIPKFCRNLLPLSLGQRSGPIQLHHSHWSSPLPCITDCFILHGLPFYPEDGETASCSELLVSNHSNYMVLQLRRQHSSLF
jgi:hypothetical protein